MSSRDRDFSYRLAAIDGSTLVPNFPSAHVLRVGDEFEVAFGGARPVRVVVTNVLGSQATVAVTRPSDRGGERTT
jgi:transcription elongation factor